MFSTKNLIINESSVPSVWAFEYYLDLPEPLTGQDIKIKSVFNPSERTPSFCVYVDKSGSKYLFKDFSTGKGGNKINLVQELFNIPYNAAVDKLVNDYNKFCKDNKVKSRGAIKVEPKWKIDFVSTRNWRRVDVLFWLPFNIGKSILEEYNVKPIDYYKMVKEYDNKVETFNVTCTGSYAYYDKSGDVIKIYNPKNSKRKFFNVKSYIQGLDQLTYEKDYLVICSSLKDAMCLRSFGYKKIEVIAPNSENSLIKPYVIENLKSKYKKVITLFDNDEAGHKAIQVYKETYNINGFALNMSKDISDAVKERGAKDVHKELAPLLKEILNK
jgi:5S rRNA maturation endonuclease (ribonuclease M5)